MANSTRNTWYSSIDVQASGKMTLTLLLLVGWAIAARLDSAQGQSSDVGSITKSRADDVFGLTRVWNVHLHVSKDAWQKMQPKGTGVPGNMAPGGPIPGNPNVPFRPGSFGYEFDYAKADIEFNGEKLSEVGLRFKGNGTYMMSASGRKRSFKIDFNRYVDDQRFYGMQQINLHNDVMDPTHSRQILGYEVFAAAGIPSPRTALAEVTLTIDGECDRELLGLYTIVEEIDKLFLRTHFKNSKGMLLKPEGTQGIEYKGESWNSYEWYEAKSPPKENEAAQFIEFARIIKNGDDRLFRSRVPQLLDIPMFARFLAANTLLSNMDSFLTQVHNYLVYLPPDTNRFVFLPWDLDLAMGAFFFAGSVEQLQELSIEHPHAGENRLIERLMAWPEFREQYRDALRTLAVDCFGPSGLTRKNLAEVQQAVREFQRRYPALASTSPFAGGFGPPQSIERFLERRYESVLSQLDGKSKGYVSSLGTPGAPMFGTPPGAQPGIPFGAPPGMGGPGIAGPGFGPPIGGFPPPGFGQPGFGPTQPGPPGFGAPGFGVSGGAGNGLGFGPGNFLGPAWMSAADQDGDKQISIDEWNALHNKWHREWDVNNDGSVSDLELIQGMNKDFGRPIGALRGQDQ